MAINAFPNGAGYGQSMTKRGDKRRMISRSSCSDAVSCRGSPGRFLPAGSEGRPLRRKQTYGNRRFDSYKKSNSVHAATKIWRLTFEARTILVTYNVLRWWDLSGAHS